MQTFDLAARGLRDLNQTLHALQGTTNQTAWEIVNTKGDEDRQDEADTRAALKCDHRTKLQRRGKKRPHPGVQTKAE